MQSMSKGLLAVTITSMFSFSVFAAGKGSTPNGKPFVELQGQIVEVEGEISSLQDQIDSIVAKVSTIEERVGANESAIASLQTQNLNLETLLLAYGSDINTLSSEVTALQQANDELQILVNAGDASLQTQIDENSLMITTLNQSIAEIGDLQSQIDNNVALMEGMQEEINAINQLLQEKQDIVDGKCPAGSSIREITASGAVVCEQDDVGGSGSATGTYKLRMVRVMETVDAPAHKQTHKKLWCPTGYTVTTGGYNIFKSTIRANGPYNFLGWSFTGINTTDHDSYFNLIINCMKLEQVN